MKASSMINPGTVLLKKLFFLVHETICYMKRIIRNYGEKCISLQRYTYGPKHVDEKKDVTPRSHYTNSIIGRQGTRINDKTQTANALEKKHDFFLRIDGVNRVW